MQLDFCRYTPADALCVRRYISGQPYRSCDFTVAGLLLWADYYGYEFAVRDDTLFVRGRAEDGRTAYLLPVGAMTPVQGAEVLRAYCRGRGEAPLLTFVPQEAAEAIAARLPCRLEQQAGWSDYLYLREKLATLPGNALHRKRNRVSKFMREFPDYSFERLGKANIADARALIASLQTAESLSDERLAYEAKLIETALTCFSELGFSGGLLRVGGQPVALTVGDSMGDTLYVHIEKASRAFEGAYETVNLLFASSFGADVVYVNREEDMGLEGLRQAKEGYCPERMVHKFNLALE